jgi:hypothetical protein
VKTPRDILLQRHREAQPKLDAIRIAVLAKETKSGEAPQSLRNILRSLRWHLVAMSAIWLFVLILRADTSRAPILAAATPQPPPPQVMIASLREHRRLLSEMTDAHPAEGERLELFVPKPHSESRGEFQVA